MIFIQPRHFYTLFIVCISILPLLSPGLQVGAFSVEPETYKTAMAVGASGILLLLWLLSHRLNEATSIVKTPFYWPVLAFLLWNIVSFFWLVDLEAGLLATLQYIAMSIGFFLILEASYQDEKNLNKLLKFLVISGLLVACLGLLQYYFRDSQAIQTFSRQAVVPGSSFGNKNMSSQFLVMVLPISVILLWRTYYINNVIFYTTTSVIMFWFLTHTYTRGGWVAITLEAFFLLLFIALDKYKNKSKSIIKKPVQTTHGPQIASTKSKRIIIAIGAIVYLAGINYSNTGWQLNTKLADRAGSIVAGDDNGRLPAWTNTLNLIKDHWLIGVGSGNWEANYPLYYDSSIDDVIYNERVRLRRLHNSYLEMASNIGLVGLFFLFWLLFLIIKAVSHILLNPIHSERYLILAMSLGLIGFSISAVVSFPLRVFLPGVIVLIYIGAIAGIYAKDKHKNNQHKTQCFLTSSMGFTKLLLLPLIILAFLLAYLSYNWLVAGHYHQKGIEYLHAGQRKKSLEFSVKSIQHSPYRAKALGLLGEGLKNTNLPLSIEYLERSVKYNPNNSLTIIALSDRYYKLATEQLKQGDQASAKATFDKHVFILKHLIKIDYRNVKGHALLVRYYVQTKQINKAKTHYEQMLTWQTYFKNRNNFGPYDGIVNAIGAMMKPHLKSL